MEKIANPLIGKCCEPSPVRTLLTFNDVAHTHFTEATNSALVAALQTWKTANPTKRIITRTPMTGMDGVNALLVEHTDLATTELPNSSVSQTYVTGATAALQLSNISTWRTDNPDAKVVSTTLLTGNDGETGYLIEYSTSSASTDIKNSKISHTYFSSADTTDYAQYLAWKLANPTYRPLRINKLVANDGEINGIYVEYTTTGSFPSGATLQQYFAADSDAMLGPADAVQGFKDDNLSKSIVRITPIIDGLLIEYMSGGSTPQSVDVSQSYYAADPDTTQAATDYQTFKTANPTLAPIRLTPIIWGNGATGILAEYISS